MSVTEFDLRANEFEVSAARLNVCADEFPVSSRQFGVPADELNVPPAEFGVSPPEFDMRPALFDVTIVEFDVRPAGFDISGRKIFCQNPLKSRYLPTSIKFFESFAVLSVFPEIPNLEGFPGTNRKKPN